VFLREKGQFHFLLAVFSSLAKRRGRDRIALYRFILKKIQKMAGEGRPTVAPNSIFP